MKQADIELQLGQKWTVPLTGVTPAEVLYLVADHHRNAGDDPIVSLVEKGEAVTFTGETKKDEKTGKEIPLSHPRTTQEEIARLRMKYPAKNLSKVFGSGYSPQFPETFEEARKAGVGIVLPSNNLIDHKLAL